MDTAIKHPVPDWIRPSFVIFDIRALCSLYVLYPPIVRAMRWGNGRSHLCAKTKLFTTRYYA